MNSREHLIATLRANEGELRSAGIRSLSLFGSAAREQEHSDSDVDIAVDLDPLAHLGLFGFVGLERRLKTLLGRPVQLMPEPVENNRLLTNLVRDRLRVF